MRVKKLGVFICMGIYLLLNGQSIFAATSEASVKEQRVVENVPYFKQQCTERFAREIYDNLYEIFITRGTERDKEGKLLIAGKSFVIFEKEELLDDFLLHDSSGQRKVDQGQKLVFNKVLVEKYYEDLKVAYKRALAALMNDYPDIFWLRFGQDGVHFYMGCEGKPKSKMTRQVNNQDKLLFYVKFEQGRGDTYSGLSRGFKDYEEVDRIRKEIDLQIALWLEQIDQEETRAQLLKKVHDRIITEIDYNKDAAKSLVYSADTSAYANAYSQVGFFNKASVEPTKGNKKGRIVCEGYAKTFKLMCDELNIPCILVSGTASTSTHPQGEAHMWNMVQLEDNNWYLVDVTWDDLGEKAQYKYFLKGSEHTTSHIASQELSILGVPFTYPVLNKADYTYQ